jgi:glutathione S-transferase
MLELYHTVNSVCAQKIRIQLVEKRLPWSSRIMTLRGDQFEPGYLKLNPNGVVPTLLHDGQPVIESSVILYYLEECFPEPPLMPASPRARMRVRLYNKLIDEKVHNACTVLTFAIALRAQFQKMTAADRERYLSLAPDRKRAAFKRDVIEQGLEASVVGDAVDHFVHLLSSMDNSLSENAYLVGDHVSLADIAVFPYIFRLNLLRLAPMWRHAPSIEAWFTRLSAREPFRQAIEGVMTPADRGPFENIQVDPWPTVETSDAHIMWVKSARSL